MARLSLLASAVAAVASARGYDASLGAHAGFPVERAKAGAPTYTYMSVADPYALNLDGSRYGIAVCLSSTSKANWTFSADGGGWCCALCSSAARGALCSPPLPRAATAVAPPARRPSLRACRQRGRVLCARVDDAGLQ